MNLLQELDVLIRTGESRRAKAKLKNFDTTKIERKYRSQFANIYLRVGMPEMSLRLLHRIVRSQKETISPTDAEKVQYAGALNAVGASSEALKILETVSTSEEPQADLFTSLTYFSNWQYQEAIPYVEAFIKNDTISEYQRVVGYLNLAAAYIFLGEYLKAETILKNLLEVTHSHEQYRLVTGNIYELLTQVAVNLKDVKQANFYIESAKTLQLRHSGITTLFLKKWGALGKTLVQETWDSGIRELQSLVSEASRRRHWETLREIHYFLAKLQRDDYSFLKVYFGTPHLNYRSKMLREHVEAPSIPREFVYHFQSYIDQVPYILDISSGEIEGSSNQKLSIGSIPHKLLWILCTDLFRPFRVSKLFSVLYPNEYFNPFSSPHRVHEAINRLRNEVKSNNMPIAILEKNGEYSISCLGPIAVRLHKTAQLGSRNRLLFNYLTLDLNQHQSFDNRYIADRLNISSRSVSRFVTWAKENDLVTAKKMRGKNLYFVNSSQSQSSSSPS